MSKKWDYKHNNEDFYCVLFMSRNKDNKNVKNFKPRRQSFLINNFHEIYSYRFHQKFLDFRDEGVNGELSRCYVSFNLRDASKVRKELLINLIEDEDISLIHITSKIVGLAMGLGMNKTKRWMFDVDTLDDDKVNGFLEELKSYGYKGVDIDSFLSTTESPELLYCRRRTINGYAVLVNRGFDTREILKGREDWVTLKRDDLVFVNWDRKD